MSAENVALIAISGINYILKYITTENRSNL